MSLRTIALATTLSVLLTSALVGAWLIQRSLTAQRALMQAQLVQLAQTVAESVDRELTAGARKLQAIALGLPDDAPSARAALYRRARDLLAIDGSMQAVALNDPRGAQLWNTRLRVGAPVTPRVFAHENRAISAMKPLVSDLYPSRSSGELIASYVVPVLIAGAPRLLVGSLDPKLLAQRLQPLATDEGAVATLLDRESRIVARTGGSGEFLGAPVSPDWARALDAEAGSGLAQVVTREGVPAYGAWARMPENGWTLLVAVPREPYRSALVQGLVLQLGAGAVLAALGTLVAYLLGRQLVAGAGRLAADAERLVIDREVTAVATGIKEFDTIQHGLVQAAARLREQDAQARVLEQARADLLDKERAARQEAEEANRFKDESLGVLGHEMRSPLAAILNAAVVLGHRIGDEGGRSAHLVQAIQRQAQTLTRLVNDLLEAGRLVGGHKQLDTPAPVDVADVVREACHMLQLSGASARHEVEMDLQPARVLGNFDRLQQVATNLLTNALRYSPPGSSVHVSLRTRSLGGPPVVELRVRDQGVGLAHEDLERVFGMFVQGSQRQANSGLGIGLSVVRRLVEMHGGDVRAESAGTGQGATFIVTLPAIAD
ncbi:sensor histidine kinase [Ramlibacter sp. AN1015]|uniref:sensor histidine kinase n=1 Tax=Ramlibacter sp. AN1015 TaxID=3133428 RepID=UPI0030BB8AA2